MFFLGGNLCLHLSYHFRQQFFTFLLAVGIDVAGVFFTVWPDRGIPPLPEFLVDLGDTACASFAPLAFVGLEGAGSGLLRRSFGCCLRISLANALVNLHCRCPAHIVGDVGVDIQRGAAGDMTNDGGECFYIHAMFQGNRRKCVT